MHRTFPPPYPDLNNDSASGSIGGHKSGQQNIYPPLNTLQSPPAGDDEWMGAVVESVSYPSQQINGSIRKTTVPAPPSERPPQPVGPRLKNKLPVSHGTAPPSKDSGRASSVGVPNGSIQHPA